MNANLEATVVLKLFRYLENWVVNITIDGEETHVVDGDFIFYPASKEEIELLTVIRDKLNVLINSPDDSVMGLCPHCKEYIYQEDRVDDLEYFECGYCGFWSASESGECFPEICK